MTGARSDRAVVVDVRHRSDHCARLRLNFRWANPARLLDGELPGLLRGVDVAVVRILGGYRAWQDGIDTVLASGVPTILVSGEQSPDADLTERSTVPAGIAVQTHIYLAHGGCPTSGNCTRSCPTRC